MSLVTTKMPEFLYTLLKRTQMAVLQFYFCTPHTLPNAPKPLNQGSYRTKIAVSNVEALVIEQGTSSHAAP